MARIGVTYFDISKAAARLAGEGKSPTVDTIRDVLGTGSKSTIAPLLKRWKSEHEQALADIGHGLPADLVHAIKLIYEQLQAAAQMKVDEAQAQRQHEQQRYAATLQTAQAELASLRQIHQATAQELMAARQHTQQLTDARHAQDLALSALSSGNAGLEHRLADRAAELQALSQQFDHLRRQFEHYQEAVAIQRVDERREADLRIGRLEQELKDRRHQIAELQPMLHELHARTQRQDDDIVQLRSNLQTSEQTVAQLRTERDQFSYQLLAMTQRCDEQAQLCASTQADRDAARTSLAGAETARTLLAEQVRLLEAKMVALQLDVLTALQEKALLQGQLKQWQRDLTA